ncbi:MAG: sensor histidine kinase [Candidatus Accumulibacter phosphatis]|jgi:two-component system LytT family sensor kinase|uniref:Sensor histidine kinase n=1 Tax=Candidatus Accumulibacter contiguus TaxID=2954381 RepID=A0ABX1T7V6_9PROT|nr:sensor histidine kinase [Candidatus Accumulibacter contiguus]NMQ05750.1 sensor histidine kinase [Candidatus Accumulibacter contiguus]
MLEEINHLALIGGLMQQMCVYLVIAYLLSKTPLFAPLMQVTVRLPGKLVCYLVFSGFCVMGTYLGFQIEGAIANTRAIGAVLGGLLGGPIVGLAVGLTGGLHRYSLGGFTDTACAVSTTVEGLIGGGLHFYLLRRHRAEQLLNPMIALGTTLFAEWMQMLIILLMARPFDQAARLVAHIALPMTLTNALGAALFMRLILDRRETLEKYSIAFSAKALRIAERSVGVLMQGFNESNCSRMAKVIQEETGVGAVAITDCEKLLGFVGVGADHHLPGTPIASPHTRHAIEHNDVVYADGATVPYCCSVSKDCKLGSCLVIPLRGEENRVFGTIKLYEPKRKFFSSLNRTLGEGIARLLSNQVLAGRIEEQKRLLAQSEIKLLQAQINPHFLFNALNTLAAVIRRDPEAARQLVQYLSTFFRKSLKRVGKEATLGDEIEHVDAYLHIELARFADRLEVVFSIPDELLPLRLPAFSLQPIVENAIKYGISQMLEPGTIRVSAERQADVLTIMIEDSAGLYRPLPDGDGLGMNLVDRRIKIRYGAAYGIEVSCEPDCWTRVAIRLPIEEELAPC